MAGPCIHCIVSGRVQGVFYRASVCEMAGRLGLHGGVRNLPDGRVEVVAAGEREALRKLREWLREGPPLARVEEVRCTKLEEIPAGFRADLSF